MYETTPAGHTAQAQYGSIFVAFTSNTKVHLAFMSTIR